MRPAQNAKAGALTQWAPISNTQQKEHLDAIESANQPATPARRIAAAVKAVAAHKARKVARKKASR
jgi:hypothetical protein